MNTPSTNDRSAWLKNPTAPCSQVIEQRCRAWRLVLLGAPGVGKGTQAEFLSQSMGGCHLSTGDIFRAAANPSNHEQTPAMKAALQYMRRGDLVPDTTVWEIVRERTACMHCRSGFVLDGFPRTLTQAQAFQELLKNEKITLDAVLDYELPMEEIIARLSGRRVCAKCKAIFHQTQNPPKVAGVCDHCGGKLIQREDDRPESVKVRMECYTRDTAPLIKFYRDLNLLRPVDAKGSPENVFVRTVKALETAT